MQDDQILYALKTDKEQGFKLLFDQYYVPLCLYVFQFTDSFDSSEDIVQGLFVKVWEQSIYNKIESNLRSYLYVSSRNAAFAYLKSHKMRPLEEVIGLEDICSEEIVNQDEIEEQLQELSIVLDKLSANQVEVVRGILMDNRRVGDVAKDMGISSNTVKTHLERAVKKLRNLISLLLF